MSERKLVLTGQSWFLLSFEIKNTDRHASFCKSRLYKRKHHRHDFAAPQPTKLGIGREKSLVLPIGLINIYPSELRNIDPRVVLSRASSKRLSFRRLRADISSLRRPVPTSHRRRVKLGVTDRSHRYLPILAEKHRSARRSIARELQTSQSSVSCSSPAT